MYSATLKTDLEHEQIRILTLNCWGVFAKHLTVKKNVRFDAICQALTTSNNDILLLQEVWENSDYQKFKTALSESFPYTVYFYNHVFGSGLCIFSKWPLKHFITYPYNLNGYPHYIHQADWPAGKSFGYASTVTNKGFRINLYNTHTHARYAMHHKDDFMEGHRLGQIIELMEFVRATASGADAIFIGGDFNVEPYTTSMRLLKTSLNLKDAWIDQSEWNGNCNLEYMENQGCTNEHPDNPFTHKSWLKIYPHGLRLDYILYRPGNMIDQKSDISVKCQSCRLEMKEIPKQNGLHYSDHIAVVGDFQISRNPTPVLVESSITCRQHSMDELLQDSVNIIKSQMQLADHLRIRHLIIAGLLIVFLLLFGTLVPVFHPGLKFFCSLFLLIGGAGVFCLVWSNSVGRNCEKNALRNMLNILVHYNNSSAKKRFSSFSE